MESNFRTAIGMPSLKETLGVTDIKSLNIKQRKAVRNIKYCSNDQWGFVNSWYDEKSEDARRFLLDADTLFSTIYNESLQNVYDEGSCSFNDGAKSYLKDIRFCGKSFLQTVALYYTAKLLEDVMPEIEATDEEICTVTDALVSIKSKLAS